MERSRLSTGSLLTLLAALAVIAFATLTPAGEGASRTGFLCLGCGSLGVPDVLVNFLLFLPLGVVLSRAGIRPLTAVGIGFVCSGLIEVAQVFIPGRAPTLRDTLINGFGAGAGALLRLRLSSWLAPGPGTRGTLWLAALCAPLAVALTGSALRFEPPRGVLIGQWVPNQGHLERFSGALHEVRVGGIAVANGRQRLRSDALYRALADSISVRLVAIAGRPTRRLSSIFSISNDAQDGALLIGPHGEDLVVRVRRVAATWRMNAPEFRFRDALADLPPGTPLAIAFDGTRLGGCATVNGTPNCVGRPRAGSAWQLARSYDGAPAIMHRILDLLTLAVLVLPFGLLVRSVPRREAIAAGVVLVVAFPLAAWGAGLALPMVWEWLGVALAIVAGRWLHARISGPASPPPRARPTPR